MSTRRLILAALVCGLAILVAGGIQLVRIANDKPSTPAVATVGETQLAGTTRATVLGRDASAGLLLVTVRLEPAGPIADAAKGWAVNAGGLLAPTSPPPGRPAPPCRGAAVPAGGSLTCELAFAAGEGRPTVSYSDGGQQRLWTLGG
jgi:hypothetical protein